MTNKGTLAFNNLIYSKLNCKISIISILSKTTISGMDDKYTRKYLNLRVTEYDMPWIIIENYLN